MALVEPWPELSPLLRRVIYSNGKASIWLTNGARCVFGTRSSRTGRGFSLDLWVADEAHYLAQEAHNALLPATNARERPPQVWYAASAVDEQIHEHGSLVLARLRKRGIARESTNLAYCEWSVGLYDDEGVELRPEQVTPEMVDDEDLWHQANPALGSRISVEHKPDRRTALVVCGRREIDDLLHLELLDSRPGSGWLLERLEYLDARYDVREIVADDYGGNRTLLRALSEAGLNVRAISGTEHVAACSKLLDLVAERGFRHIGQLEFLQALRGAKSKPVGDAWVWSRKASSGDAALVVAMTLALAAGAEIPVDAGEIRIY